MHDFILAAGPNHIGIRAVLKAQHHFDLGAQGFTVESERRFATPVKDR
jgi:hypothetical protein